MPAWPTGARDSSGSPLDSVLLSLTALGVADSRILLRGRRCRMIRPTTERNERPEARGLD